ncbi:MAG: T9SS type A sorting domain-containing protein [Elusimicrobia bacterium]|nr:T9SS type A sorting domain-containing protein [Elusimicrobiota bacterium]
MRKFCIIIVFILSFSVFANKIFATGENSDTGTLAWDPNAYTNTISWNAATPLPVDYATNTVITYYIFRQFGQINPEVVTAAISTEAVNGSKLLGTTDKTNWTDQLYAIGISSFGADYRYLVVAVDNNSTPAVAGDDVSTTIYTFSDDKLDFIHTMKRADALGSQDGFGQEWTFTYKLKWDAYINIEVYSPNGTFTIGTSNVDTTYDGEVVNSSSPVKTIVDYTDLESAARSFQMADDSYTNEDVWDCRDSSGNVVPNGLYYVLFRAYTHNPFTGTPKFVGQWWGSIPVDILRITDIGTKGLSGTGGTASINYTINGDANVYILICSSGTTFTRATAEGDLTFLTNNTYHYYEGFPLPLNDAKTAVDASKLQKVLVFYRKYGTYSETWNGLDQNGGTLPNGIYTVSFAGRDGFGNNALDSEGNDGPIETTITVDKTQSETASDSTPPTVNTDSLTPAAGSIQAAAVSVISCVITDSAESGVNASGFSAAASTITLTGPNGTVTGTTAFDPTTGVFSLTFATPITTDGTYTARVIPSDNSGNVAADTTWIFSISVTEAGAATTFIESIKAYPNPAQGVPANIEYSINSAATLTLEIFTLLGELVYEKEWVKTTAGTYTETWALLNDSTDKVGTGVYIFRIKADTGTNSYNVSKKLVVIQ